MIASVAYLKGSFQCLGGIIRVEEDIRSSEFTGSSSGQESPLLGYNQNYR